MISTSGPAAEIPDVTDGCAVKSYYERNWGCFKTVVPEARYDRTSSKTQLLGAVQASGPPLLSAQAGGYVQLTWITPSFAVRDVAATKTWQGAHSDVLK